MDMRERFDESVLRGKRLWDVCIGWLDRKMRMSMEERCDNIAVFLRHQRRCRINEHTAGIDKARGMMQQARLIFRIF